jgi:gliding motility-associated-like protein
MSVYKNAGIAAGFLPLDPSTIGIPRGRVPGTRSFHPLKNLHKVLLFLRLGLKKSLIRFGLPFSLSIMLRHISCLISGVLLSGIAGFTQPVINISNATANNGQVVDINLSVDNFTDLISMEFIVRWSANVISYQSASNFAAGLPAFGPASINLVQDGELRLSWNEPNLNPISLPNGTTLFTITAIVTGIPCDSTGVFLTDIEIVDENENIVNTQVNPGYVTVPGTGCGTFNGVRIIGEQKTVNSGSPVCIKFTTEGFQDIVAGSYAITFNPAVIQYTGIQNINWPDFMPGTTYSDGEAASGILRVVWSDPSTQGISLPNGTVLYELCFNAIGAGGQMSEIGFSSIPPTIIEFANSDSEVVPFEGVPGKVTIEGPIEGFALILGNAQAAPGAEVCVPITVNDFINIIAVGATITWDSTILQFLRFEGFNLPGLAEAVAGPEAPGLNASQAAIAWIDNSLNGVTLSNGAEMMRICFRVIGSCDQVSQILFTSSPNILEAADVDGEIPVIAIAGSVTVNCDGCGAVVVNVQDICAGGEVGGIDIELLGVCEGPVSYLWSNNATTQDLVGVVAGKYVVTITTGSTFIILDTITIRVLDPIQVSANITHATTGNNGAIGLTVSGGRPGYTYLWSNTQTTQNISGLAPGTYTVTVTDSNDCTFVASFTVSDANAILATITPVTCFGTPTGSISITAVNCVPGPHTYQWSGTIQTTQTITNLLAGTYTVTVTGAGGATCTATYQVPQATSALAVVITVTDETMTGNDGAIDLTVTGGQPEYTYSWSHGLPPTQDQSGLAGGQYSVTITDAYGCMLVRTILVRGNALFVNLNGSSYSGFGVSCAGTCDGEIFAMPGNAIGNVSYLWSNGSTSSLITGVCPGTYSVTVTDVATGQTAIMTHTLTEPNALLLQLDINCASAFGVNDGSAIASVSGGAPPYSFLWNTGNTSSSIQNVGPGPLTLVVTDDNNCEVTQRLDICIEGVECYKAISVITPNGDGKNDEFVINCIYEQSNLLSIYNRYGGLEFEMRDYDNSWRGTDQSGNLLSDGGYLWVLQVYFPNGGRSIYKGTVSLVRSLN